MSPLEPEWRPTPRPWPAPPPERRWGTGWSDAGIIIAVVIAILGLAVLAGAVLFVVSLSRWGYNK